MQPLGEHGKGESRSGVNDKIYFRLDISRQIFVHNYLLILKILNFKIQGGGSGIFFKFFL